MNEEMNNLNNIELMKEMYKEIIEIKNILYAQNEKLEKQDKRFESMENIIDKKLENINKLEKFHFEYTRNRFSKINKKIENEIKQRKEDISKIERINDFDKIVLSEFGSRISILEEESEKYMVN